VDANEFLKKVTRAGSVARLAPFWNDITKLRQSGCTLEQVCEFLAANGVQMSIAGLSKYIKRREEKGEQATPKPAFGHDQAARPAAPSHDEEPPATPDAAGAETSQLTTRQRGEALADQYMKPASTNPALKRLNKEKK